MEELEKKYTSHKIQEENESQSSSTSSLDPAKRKQGRVSKRPSNSSIGSGSGHDS